jgi:glycosyltransferase involved in cell wall biosynthesis
MASIRVFHLAPTAFGDEGLFGGGERYPLELARALNGLDGLDCELVTFGRRARTEYDATGLRTRVLEPIAHLRGHPAHPITPALMGALAGADIVHAHHVHSTPTRLAALIARLRAQRVVVTDHGLAGRNWGGMVSRLFDRFLTVSRYSAATLGVRPDKTRVIYGGADTHRFSPDPDVRREGVVFVGRITPHKGLDVLIRALPDGVPLTVVGTGGHDRRAPDRGYPALVRTLAVDRDVRFAGAVADRDLPDVYRHAAVVAIPSVSTTYYGRRVAISELLGLSALEAMASGTPVVASRIGGLCEVVVDGETGSLVEPGNVVALHDRLRELLDQPTKARVMGDNARALVRERFTWEHCARRCRDAYRELVS